MRRLSALVVAALLIASGCAQRDPAAITGPYQSLLAESVDLGPSRAADAQLTAVLARPGRPEALMEWAAAHRLWVRWRDGNTWAIVEGAAADLAAAFDVPVHDYRRREARFYASPRQPAVPPPLRGVVSAVGRILSYTPHRMAIPGMLPLDVPKGGLSPRGLLQAYDALPLAEAGFTGRGATIVFFAFDKADQQDLDTFSDSSGLPRFTPVIVGGQPPEAHGETTMDLEVAHAIAPEAQLVVVNARPTVEGDGAYEKIARMFAEADRRFPGAIWSLSISWGCEGLVTAADLAPVREALIAAQRRGTSAFIASGDTGGMECKGGDEFSSPPEPEHIGLHSIGAIPEMTAVGGTTLSVSPRGQWLGEYPWVDSPMSQGTSGGVSVNYERPQWQRHLTVERDNAGRRLAPDVSAVADPFTGVRLIFGQREVMGGGTSQAAPIWAALTVLINQYLVANGGHPVGNLNPLLYRIAQGANEPAFRDVRKGGNAVDLAQPGYDLVSGLGSPDTDNLARDILDIQLGRAPR